MTRRTLLFALAQSPPREIRLICAAPSPYTGRRDSYRAGHGIFACLRRLIGEHALPLQASYYDATPHLGKPEALKRLLSAAPTLLIGTSVWAQGPSSVSRSFFEAVNTHSLAGQSASTWVTSGGAHTGAALAFDSNLATLRSMGAAVFGFGQKQMVFTTDERLSGERPGEFTLLDLWFMEGLAKAAIVQTLAAGQPVEARALYEKLNSDPAYYLKYFPKSTAELEPRFNEIRLRLNAAAPPRSMERKELDALLSRLAAE
ncbi:MAG: hypothetical protein K7J46_02465 [Bryobacter sp.]|jgi:hypothetical protein|nr:hypothetical protein [Bryobacter sp. CoA8 C33]